MSFVPPGRARPGFQLVEQTPPIVPTPVAPFSVGSFLDEPLPTGRSGVRPRVCVAVGSAVRATVGAGIGPTVFPLRSTRGSASVIEGRAVPRRVPRPSVRIGTGPSAVIEGTRPQLRARDGFPVVALRGVPGPPSPTRPPPEPGAGGVGVLPDGSVEPATRRISFVVLPGVGFRTLVRRRFVPCRLFAATLVAAVAVVLDDFAVSVALTGVRPVGIARWLVVGPSQIAVEHGPSVPFGRAAVDVLHPARSVRPVRHLAPRAADRFVSPSLLRGAVGSRSGPAIGSRRPGASIRLRIVTRPRRLRPVPTTLAASIAAVLVARPVARAVRWHV